ncbi:MAG: hypothetical protein COV29_03200 [Candidatus Yanofskybacteria bacterium CG10_big_fil_rev_8_21_14_0_10_36_16]|uniref:Thioredoxin domain-containing protein n=1 Tax=Candidatus Yanofskybacteria bacterium CG10_big_fil_rev_8_21_14_0_10_36_16 TaxID=1975096 RepID=A0A2J0QAL3_9BACT|nr:MAG: hypothetical protein COV29_03200 [Candidatus Yanofskybacteria bacterium CG10_big_fil_rev_8_21_14_0_10_36_16]
MEEQNNQNTVSDDSQMTKKERRELKKQQKEEDKVKRVRSKKTKRVVSWVVVLVLLGGVVWAMAYFGGKGVERDDSGTVILSTDITTEDWIKGNPNAELVLVEYSDFQCPACGAYYPLVKQLSEDFGDRLAIVYRHFPLITIHKNAELAARASEAAGKQGKFWEMHDVIFETQSAWSNLNREEAEKSFVSIAERLDLNVTQFVAHLNADDIANAVNDDIASARSSAVNATPTFFLNGKKLTNPNSYEAFKEIIQNSLSASELDQGAGAESESN